MTTFITLCTFWDIGNSLRLTCYVLSEASIEYVLIEVKSRGWIYATTYMERCFLRFFSGRAGFGMNTGIGIKWNMGDQWKVRVQRHPDPISDTPMFSRIIPASM